MVYKHRNYDLTRINQKGGAEYIFKTSSSKTINELITYLKKYDSGSQFKLINETNTLQYKNIHKTELQTMENLLSKHFPDADISKDENRFIVSPVSDLKHIPILTIYQAIPNSINLQTTSETLYSYTITTDAIAQYKDYLQRTGRLDLISVNKL